MPCLGNLMRQSRIHPHNSTIYHVKGEYQLTTPENRQTHRNRHPRLPSHHPSNRIHHFCPTFPPPLLSPLSNLTDLPDSDDEPQGTPPPILPPSRPLAPQEFDNSGKGGLYNMPPGLGRGQRIKNAQQNQKHPGTTVLAFETAHETAFATTLGGPKTYAEAMERPKAEAEKWHEAAMQELQSLIEMGVFEMVELPRGRTAIGNRWVFRVKLNGDGTVERYKARLVAKGYAQRPGFDFTETFAPTPKWATLRLILALAALEDLELWSVDISSAYLYGDISEDVYMELPEGSTRIPAGHALKLLKSLYGLKQAGHQWHLKLHEVLSSMGYKRVRCEHSVWVYETAASGTRVIVPVFIDDMTIAAKSVEEVRAFIDELSKHFKLRDLGPTKWLLGVEIERDRESRKLSMSQRQYILDVLERASMTDCNPVTTPMDPKVQLTANDCPKSAEDIAKMKNIPYLHILGAIAYLAVATRPDIAYAVGVLSRFSKNPGWTHWIALKRVLRYLKGTIDQKLTFSGTMGEQGEFFTTYSDADHGGNPDNGRSTSGFVIMMGGGAISWSSRLQSFVTLSTTEAEYVSAVSAGQEIIWLQNLLEELGYRRDGGATLLIDNQSAISVAKNPDHHGRVKHLDLRFYWLRDVVAEKRILVEHCSTVDMTADVMTKGLGREKMENISASHWTISPALARYLKHAFRLSSPGLEALYLTSAIIFLLFVRIPIWTIQYIFPFGRPRRQWSLGRSLIVSCLGVFLNILYSTSLLPSPPIEKLAKDGADAGFVWIEATPSLIHGDVSEKARKNGVEAVRTGGFWFGERGADGKAGQKAGPDELVFYHFHGGGFVMSTSDPSTSANKVLFSGLLQHTKVRRVFALEYRLSSAPPFGSRNPFPAALIDSIAGYRYLVEDVGFNLSNIIISGDSAGGNLAYALTRYISTDGGHGLPNAGALLLLSPTVDWADTHIGADSSMRRNSRTDFVLLIFTSRFTYHALRGSLPDDEIATNSWISPGSLKNCSTAWYLHCLFQNLHHCR
ncbi:Integrase catalytic domain-containing protein [Mycena sanguinolenta]|uniref:Integrase catalytic domain-containing protein n=1 Tax=Mycena sanguinolenta TaxID=230812 RepID=A0A8H7CQ99_9AGAR|nr:Integrase catalytic domain-containing protein [Mycena sanguinolenta]